jgi:hypothetical protein
MRILIFILISVCMLVIIIETATTVRSVVTEPPSVTFARLTEPPPRTIENPRMNGYLLLLGFASAPLFDPVQAGHDMWLEVESARGHRYYQYASDLRSRLRLSPEDVRPLDLWRTPDPIGTMVNQLASLRRAMAQPEVLLARYRLWLSMPFEDWGYEHPGVPRSVEIVAAHRLYLAEGFSRGHGSGLERLEKDMLLWRSVLAKARTLPIKLLASALVEEDAALLSVLLNQAVVDRRTLVRLSRMAQPMNREERSLRWPIQHQFLLEVRRHHRTVSTRIGTEREDAVRNSQWLAEFVGLTPDALKRSEQPRTEPGLFTDPQQQRILNVYADFYAATITAVEESEETLPTLRDVAREAPHRMLDILAGPLDSLSDEEAEPSWTPIAERIRETDARLRLAGLLAKLRRPTRTPDIRTRLAEAGTDYFDPFSGLTMLWNPKRLVIYSMGPDRQDDGGDRNADLTVPLLLPLQTLPPRAPGRPARAFRAAH